MQIGNMLLRLLGHRCPVPRPSVRFYRALLCTDCTMLTESGMDRCPVCGSASVVLLCTLIKP